MTLYQAEQLVIEAGLSLKDEYVARTLVYALGFKPAEIGIEYLDADGNMDVTSVLKYAIEHKSEPEEISEAIRNLI